MKINYETICEETADMSEKETSTYIREDVMGNFTPFSDVISTCDQNRMGEQMCELSRRTGCRQCMCEPCCTVKEYKDCEPIYSGDGFQNWLDSSAYYPEDVIWGEEFMNDIYKEVSGYGNHERY